MQRCLGLKRPQPVQPPEHERAKRLVQGSLVDVSGSGFAQFKRLKQLVQLSGRVRAQAGVAWHRGVHTGVEADLLPVLSKPAVKPLASHFENPDPIDHGHQRTRPIGPQHRHGAAVDLGLVKVRPRRRSGGPLAVQHVHRCLAGHPHEIETGQRGIPAHLEHARLPPTRPLAQPLQVQLANDGGGVGALAVGVQTGEGAEKRRHGQLSAHHERLGVESPAVVLEVLVERLPGQLRELARGGMHDHVRHEWVVGCHKGLLAVLHQHAVPGAVAQVAQVAVTIKAVEPWRLERIMVVAMSGQCEHAVAKRQRDRAAGTSSKLGEEIATAQASARRFNDLAASRVRIPIPRA
eukprot:m.445384 g.445384  ORF g.445384 m.445384 type:complete len:349 (-) comp20303_c0_seq1:833-1879(-)